MKFKTKSVDEATGIFEGLAAAFGNIDDGGDVIHKGAFTDTIVEDFDKIKILFNHDESALPIGKPLLFEERDEGLYMKAQLSMTAKGKDVLTLLKDGVLKEMSIGYCIIEDDNDFEGIHHLYKLKLFEVSVVNFPMNEKAIVSSVKSQGNKSKYKEYTISKNKIKKYKNNFKH